MAHVLVEVDLTALRSDPAVAAILADLSTRGPCVRSVVQATRTLALVAGRATLDDPAAVFLGDFSEALRGPCAAPPDASSSFQFEPRGTYGRARLFGVHAQDRASSPPTEMLVAVLPPDALLYGDPRTVASMLDRAVAWEMRHETGAIDAMLTSEQRAAPVRFAVDGTGEGMKLGPLPAIRAATGRVRFSGALELSVRLQTADRAGVRGLSDALRALRAEPATSDAAPGWAETMDGLQIAERGDAVEVSLRVDPRLVSWARERAAAVAAP